MLVGIDFSRLKKTAVYPFRKFLHHEQSTVIDAKINGLCAAVK